MLTNPHDRNRTERHQSNISSWEACLVVSYRYAVCMLVFQVFVWVLVDSYAVFKYIHLTIKGKLQAANAFCSAKIRHLRLSWGCVGLSPKECISHGMFPLVCLQNAAEPCLLATHALLLFRPQVIVPGLLIKFSTFWRHDVLVVAFIIMPLSRGHSHPSTTNYRMTWLL